VLKAKARRVLFEEAVQEAEVAAAGGGGHITIEASPKAAKGNSVAPAGQEVWVPMIPPSLFAEEPPLAGFDMVHRCTSLNDLETHFVGRIEARCQDRPQEGGGVMLGIGLGYGAFAVLVILIVCLWAVGLMHPRHAGPGAGEMIYRR
jgi:hypothetical protein